MGRDDGRVVNGGAGRGVLTAVGVRETGWWVLGLGVLGGALFTVALFVRLSCAAHHCASRQVRHLLDLDQVGSLPRLFITALFVAVAMLAARAAARSCRPARWWWVLVALGCAVLAGAKLVSAHSAAEEVDGRTGTLLGGLLLSLVGLPVLWWCGRRWSVPAAGAVTFALALYAAAALGLDQLTALVHHEGSGRISVAVATFVEEGGEAATALLLLSSVARWLPGAVGS